MTHGLGKRPSGGGQAAGQGPGPPAPRQKKLTEGQLELNKLELQEAPRSYLRLWRSFLFWVLSLCFLYVVIAQPLLTFYFPGLPLPVVSEELSDTIIRLLLVGLGAGY